MIIYFFFFLELFLTFYRKHQNFPAKIIIIVGTSGKRPWLLFSPLSLPLYTRFWSLCSLYVLRYSEYTKNFEWQHRGTYWKLHAVSSPSKSVRVVSGPLLGKDPLCFYSCKRPPPVLTTTECSHFGGSLTGGSIVLSTHLDYWQVNVFQKLGSSIWSLVILGLMAFRLPACGSWIVWQATLTFTFTSFIPLRVKEHSSFPTNKPAER